MEVKWFMYIRFMSYTHWGLNSKLILPHVFISLIRNVKWIMRNHKQKWPVNLQWTFISAVSVWAGGTPLSATHTYMPEMARSILVKVSVAEPVWLLIGWLLPCLNHVTYGAGNPFDEQLMETVWLDDASESSRVDHSNWMLLGGAAYRMMKEYPKL